MRVWILPNDRMAPIRVVQLVPGMIRRQNGMVLEAHSSVTLVSTPGSKMVVDTSTVENRELLVSRLEFHGLALEDVDTVINTHLHMDHSGNNDLFSEARFLAHVDEIPPRPYEPVLENMELVEGVELIHTPGHTRGSMTVLVQADKRYAIAGDALPTKDNYGKWVPPNLNYHPQLALRSMERIVEMADVIVPGHDEAFPVDR